MRFMYGVLQKDIHMIQIMCLLKDINTALGL